MAEIDLLTDRQIRALQPRKKAFKLTDGRAMHLLITPAGGKLWRLKYRINGKEKLFALGPFPDVSVKEARDARDAARKLIEKGIDPVAAKHEQSDAKREASKFLFETAAEDFFRHKQRGWSEVHRRDVRRVLNELNEGLGDKAMASITHEDIKRVIEKIEKRGALTYARDVRLYFRQVVKHFNAENRKHRIADPSVDITIDEPPKVRHHPALPPDQIGVFLRKVAGSPAAPLVRLATRMLLLTAVRTTELRKAEWREFDLKGKVWRVPASRMKSDAEHLVPLSPQVIALLAELRTISGEGVLLFPNLLNPKEPISENTVIAHIKRLGFAGRHTSHGCRSTFSTFANEAGFTADAVERQLAHAPRDAVRAAYLRSQFLPERVKMMSAWADYCDEAERTNVVSLGRKAGAK